jgi:hypothetical protein
MSEDSNYCHIAQEPCPSECSGHAAFCVRSNQPKCDVKPKPWVPLEERKPRCIKDREECPEDCPLYTRPGVGICPKKLVSGDDRVAWYQAAHEDYRDLKDGGMGSYSGFPQTEKLAQCASILHDAFGEYCYQVGSSLETKRWRDVDVRMIMSDEKYDKLFGTAGISPFWSVLCISISSWMREVTGLPVDFQIQRQSFANTKYGGGLRNALGIGYRLKFTDEHQPDWLREIPQHESD